MRGFYTREGPAVKFSLADERFEPIFSLPEKSFAIRRALVSTAKGGGLMSNCFGERVMPREFTKDSTAFGVRF
jgi:hypothetical protein